MDDNEDGHEDGLVDSFKEVCAVDEAKARQYLLHCDWDLPTAIQLFFQTGGTLQNTHEGENNRNNEELELRQRNVPRPELRNVPNVNAAAPAARPRQVAPVGWVDWLLAVAVIPFRLTITTIWEILAVLSDLFLARPRIALTDPRGDVEQFRSDYAQHYAQNTRALIQFYPGSYDDAVREAKQSLRMMLVYLHNPDSKDTIRYVADVLHSDQVQTIINNNNLLVWGVSISSPQGQAAVTHMRPTSYPFLALLSLKNNTMSVAIRLCGMCDGETAALNLGIAIQDHVAQMNILRMQKAQREEDQRIRAEQEREYRESATKDRAKLQERRRLESVRVEAEELEREKQRKNEDRKAEIEARRLSLRDALVEEPADGDIVRVQVRFPSGARFDRKFGQDDSVETLFTAIIANEKCPNFITVHTTYPRKELICSPKWYHELRTAQLEADGGESPNAFVEPRSFREEGFDKSCVVMIHDCQA